MKFIRLRIKAIFGSKVCIFSLAISLFSISSTSHPSSGFEKIEKFDLLFEHIPIAMKIFDSKKLTTLVEKAIQDTPDTASIRIMQEKNYFSIQIGSVQKEDYEDQAIRTIFFSKSPVKETYRTDGVEFLSVNNSPFVMFVTRINSICGTGADGELTVANVISGVEYFNGTVGNELFYTGLFYISDNKSFHSSVKKWISGNTKKLKHSARTGDGKFQFHYVRHYFPSGYGPQNSNTATGVAGIYRLQCDEANRSCKESLVKLNKWSAPDSGTCD